MESCQPFSIIGRYKAYHELRKPLSRWQTQWRLFKSVRSDRRTRDGV